MEIKAKDTAFLTVDLKAVQYNYNFLKSFIGENCTLGVVPKSNALGLGLEKITKFLYKNGCKDFFVAYPKEGEIIRKITKDKEINIYVFSGFFNEDKKCIKKYNLIPILNSVYEIVNFEKFCKKEEKNFPCCIKVDTGFSRHGLSFDEIEEYKNVITRLDVKIILSHLACSEDKNNAKNAEQLQNFLKVKEFLGDGYKYSLCATCGVFLGKNYHFDIVRVGYGLFCSGASSKLKNAVGMYAKILQVKHIKQGDTVGYGASFVAKKDMKIAIIGIGYSHGLFKNLKDCKYWAYIGDQKCNFIGKISMEYSTIDVTNIYDKYLQIGTPVELIGPHRNLIELAHDLNTNPSDILVKTGNIEKVYIEK